ncbi:MAG TPA: M48 family metalloprotease [Ktedonobacterales bacterium]
MQESASLAAPQPCPICSKPTSADQFGFVECVCGWGGPGDPVESVRGASRAFTLLDRRLAGSMARRELARIARKKSVASSGDLLYLALLTVMSTVIYLVIGALFVGSIIWFVQLLMGRAWIGAVLAGVIVLYLYWALFGMPQRIRGIVAPISDYPRLAAVLAEVAQRVGVKTPRWVILFPSANFSLNRRMLWGRSLFPQMVVGVGAASLAQMNDLEIRAILAYLLAHYRHEHTLLARFFRGAETAMYHIIDGLVAGISTNFAFRGVKEGTLTGSPSIFRLRNEYYTARSNTNIAMMAAVFVLWIVLAPLRLLWFVFHLMRLRQSRASEYESDAAAIETYGPQSFINGLTAALATAATMRGSILDIRDEMVKRNDPNFFAELRRHYAELPANYLGEIRKRATLDYRSLERSHPITPDRIRAAILLGIPDPVVAQTPQSAAHLLTPAGAADASGVERQLTDILFASAKRR